MLGRIIIYTVSPNLESSQAILNFSLSKCNIQHQATTCAWVQPNIQDFFFNKHFEIENNSFFFNQVSKEPSKRMKKKSEGRWSGQDVTDST